jgi:hypothetical protein
MAGLGAAGLVLAVLAGPAEAEAPFGTYAVEGTNPGTSEGYSGEVTVTASGGTYAVTWTIGGTVYHGTGIDNGESFAVVYDGGGMYGVAVYKPAGNGAWQGLWAVVGGSEVGFEHWTPR